MWFIYERSFFTYHTKLILSQYGQFYKKSEAIHALFDDGFTRSDLPDFAFMRFVNTPPAWIMTPPTYKGDLR